jgi:hypothetical protein
VERKRAKVNIQTESGDTKPLEDQTMAKRTIEIDDCLQEQVDGAIDDVKQALLDYLEENPDTNETPDIGNDLDYSGTIHEIVDGAVPVYTSEINDLFYLYGNDFEQAFDDAGIGSKDDEGWPSGWKAAAIYCYIDEKVHEWYAQNADDVFEEWQEKRDEQADDESDESDTQVG